MQDYTRPTELFTYFSSFHAKFCFRIFCPFLRFLPIFLPKAPAKWVILLELLHHLDKNRVNFLAPLTLWLWAARHPWYSAHRLIVLSAPVNRKSKLNFASFS